MTSALTILILMFAVGSQGQLYEGDGCRVGHDGSNGVCKNFRSCSELSNAYRQRQKVTTCSYMSGVAIVCCPLGQTAPERQRPSITLVEAPQNTRPRDETTFRPIQQAGRPSVQPLMPTGGRISLRKCSEYKRNALQKRVAGDLSNFPKYFTISEETCAYTTGLIVGGIKAKSGEFPHMAAMGFRNLNGQTEFYCGGSLISESYVLTAAHCRKHTKERPFVRLGGLNLQDNDGRDVNVAQFIRHEAYSKDSKQNDIMLLRLEQQVAFSPRIRPICLSQISNIEEKKALASGWGATEYAGSNSDALLKVGLDILDLSLCKTAFEDYEDVIINNNQMCSGILAGKHDTCQGDSGGPLQVITRDNKCVYEILGITSFSTPTCGNKNSPSVYTKVSAYLDWIEAKVWPNQ